MGSIETKERRKTKKKKKKKGRIRNTGREVLQKPRRKSVIRNEKYLKYLTEQMPQDGSEEHLRLDIPQGKGPSLYCQL